MTDTPTSKKPTDGGNRSVGQSETTNIPGGIPNMETLAPTNDSIRDPRNAVVHVERFVVLPVEDDIRDDEATHYEADADLAVKLRKGGHDEDFARGGSVLIELNPDGNGYAIVSVDVWRAEPDAHAEAMRKAAAHLGVAAAHLELMEAHADERRKAFAWGREAERVYGGADE